MLALFLVLGASLNAQDVATPVQPVQTISQTACGTYNFHYYDSRAGIWSNFHCCDIYVDESGFFPVVHFQLLETGDWTKETIFWGDDYDIIDNGDGMKSGHAGVAVDNPIPFGYIDGQWVSLEFCFPHYGPDGERDGWIGREDAHSPWIVFPMDHVWWFKPPTP